MQHDFFLNTDANSTGFAARLHRNLNVAVLFLVGLFVCMASAVLVPGGLGALVGYQQVQTLNHEAAIIHLNRGLGYLAENYPELARSEFEIALKYDASFEPARQKLSELQKPNGSGTSGAPTEDRVAVALFDEARGLIAQKQWSDAITRLEQLRTRQADYKQAEVNDLLYAAYVNSGKAAVASGQIEIARERFESALAIRSSDAEVKRQRDLAALYLEGQQAVGFSWQTAVQKFTALYEQDPNYDDIKRRLFDAHLEYGDKACREGAWALAQREYDGALALLNDPRIAQKRAQAQTVCRKLPVPTATGATLPAGSPAPAGIPTATGTPAAESYTRKTSAATDKPCTGPGSLSGVVRDVLGRAMVNVAVGYYADDIPLVSQRTNATGQYQFTLGKDSRVLHVILLGADSKTPISEDTLVYYPGANVMGCHIVIEWQKVQ
jgi:Tfp pilus assembly protein PilF